MWGSQCGKRRSGHSPTGADVVSAADGTWRQAADATSVTAGEDTRQGADLRALQPAECDRGYGEAPSLSGREVFNPLEPS